MKLQEINAIKVGQVLIDEKIGKARILKKYNRFCWRLLSEKNGIIAVYYPLKENWTLFNE